MDCLSEDTKRIVQEAIEEKGKGKGKGVATETPEAPATPEPPGTPTPRETPELPSTTTTAWNTQLVSTQGATQELQFLKFPLAKYKRLAVQSWPDNIEFGKNVLGSSSWPSSMLCVVDTPLSTGSPSPPFPSQTPSLPVPYWLNTLLDDDYDDSDDSRFLAVPLVPLRRMWAPHTFGLNMGTPVDPFKSAGPPPPLQPGHIRVRLGLTPQEWEWLQAVQPGVPRGRGSAFVDGLYAYRACEDPAGGDRRCQRVEVDEPDADMEPYITHPDHSPPLAVVPRADDPNPSCKLCQKSPVLQRVSRLCAFHTCYFAGARTDEHLAVLNGTQEIGSGRIRGVADRSTAEVAYLTPEHVAKTITKAQLLCNSTEEQAAEGNSGHPTVLSSPTSSSSWLPSSPSSPPPLSSPLSSPPPSSSSPFSFSLSASFSSSLSLASS
ncbi:hypothetical protein F4677DRAFT_232780 [Hypoxylon crocopeplum]|nr:hypothetical protein F4677DRAFT_232780 [Hypoxylon crocopeplum]